MWLAFNLELRSDQQMWEKKPCYGLKIKMQVRQHKLFEPKKGEG